MLWSQVANCDKEMSKECIYMYTHTHTHTLSLSLFLSCTRTHARTCTRTRTRTHTHTQEGQCPQRVVECKYCELDVKAADYDTHIDACGSRTDYCDKCNVRVMLKDMEEHKLAKCGDLKAVEFPMEPTLENLPPAYMDGYSPGNPGGISQGPLIGGEEYFFHGPGQGVLGGPPNFGMPPDYLEEGAIFYGGTRDERGREDNVQVSDYFSPLSPSSAFPPPYSILYASLSSLPPSLPSSLFFPPSLPPSLLACVYMHLDVHVHVLIVPLRVHCDLCFC